MTGMPIAHITPGAVVFARVSGFPWWPAVVNKCPHNQRWTEEGKYWVIFFNEKNGAWLKPAELRAFDAYNQDLCLEYNSGPSKFRRYRDKIDKAIDLAEEYLSNETQARSPTMSVEGRRLAKRASGDVISISDAAAAEKDVNGDLPGASTGRKRMQPEKSSLRRTRRHASRQRELEQEESDHSNDDGGRSRRKRMRSAKHQTVAGSSERGNGEKRAEEMEAGGSGNRSMKGGNRGAIAVIPYDLANGTALVGGKKKGEGGNSEPQGAGGRLRSRASRRPTRGGGQDGEEDVDAVEAVAPSRRMSRRIATRKVISRRLAQEPIPRSKADPDNRPDPATTREMYISELNELVGPKGRQKMGELGKNAFHGRGSTGSGAIGSSRLESSDSDQGTDSEEGPERFRRIMNGSLEAAAEDLMECALRRENGGMSESVSRREDILDMDTLALGGNELVSSILNRITDLERDVLMLRQKATGKEQAILGEDASAAGLKSAVEALAAAADAYAKSRDYNAGVIGRSLQLLWPVGGHFPLPGADGELLRTITKSLVVGCCKQSEKNGARNARTMPPRQPAPKRRGDQPSEHRPHVRHVASMSRAISSAQTKPPATPEEVLDSSSAGRDKGSESSGDDVVLVPNSMRAQKEAARSKKIRGTRKGLNQAENEENASSAFEVAPHEAVESEEVVDGNGVDRQVHSDVEGDESEPLGS
eukprot:GFKZ01013496.1.p2 GENE.GFKZ01013496.1~~GFKZ01013496.1.p2  ORF type:complete len:704 (-),score=104.27 GFKZ01013496.1:2272-4383(-)